MGKESKCMLGTYFTLILAMFIVMVVGAVLGYSGNLEEIIKNPLEDALKKYQDNPTQDGMIAYKKIWNEVQVELRCCGVDNASDWLTDEHGFENGFNKPEGCCKWMKSGDEITGNTAKEACRKADASVANTMYNFEGCYTKIEKTIVDNQDIVVGVAIAVV